MHASPRILAALLLAAPLAAQSPDSPFEMLIRQGEFSKATEAMQRALAAQPQMDPLQRLHLEFEIERLRRIRLDFDRSESEVLGAIRRYIPEAGAEQLAAWEKAGTLEVMTIDGVKRYFDRAAPNLFLLDATARARKEAVEAQDPPSRRSTYSRLDDVRRIIATAEALRHPLVSPRRLRMTYTLRVRPDAVPPGEVLRAWLPYPREGHGRQCDIELLWTEPDCGIIAPNEAAPQRTVYLEKPAEEGEATVFSHAFEFSTFAHYQAIEPARVLPCDEDSPLYERYTEERSPHLTFHQRFRDLAREITGGEKNPYLKARKIFQWVDAWVPWAGAREYSTIRDIPMYCYEKRHGDCGMQTLFFMNLARLSGIPVRWQSGWSLAPGEENLHDWCEMYIEPYGWLPVDQSIGLQESEDERVKWFYLGSTDGWRWIINDDYSSDLYPAKIHPRSETVDFQRGEVEWRGGNLYFDQWSYDLDVEVLE